MARNHDLWINNPDSLVLYEKILPTIVNKCGFHYLDQKPFIKGDVGFAGNIGWYDYSFKDSSLPIPERYYLNKRWPNMVTWNDGRYVHLGMSDIAFARLLNDKLKRHFASVSRQVNTIICAFHHVPFTELLRTRHTSMDKFLTAFSGNKKTG